MRASEQLIEAACAGDEVSISQLLAICQPDIKRFARRTCSNSEDAEDAAQIALWQLYRKIGALRVVATFASWLFRIVERECYRLFSKREAMVSLHEADLEVEKVPLIPTDLRADLAAAIGVLPERYRVVLILRDIDGLTTPEVAAELGITIEAVKSRLHRARTRVRERLTANGYWSSAPKRKVRS